MCIKRLHRAQAPFFYLSQGDRVECRFIEHVVAPTFLRITSRLTEHYYRGVNGFYRPYYSHYFPLMQLLLSALQDFVKGTRLSADWPPAAAHEGEASAWCGGPHHALAAPLGWGGQHSNN